MADLQQGLVIFTGLGTCVQARIVKDLHDVAGHDITSRGVQIDFTPGPVAVIVSRARSQARGGDIN